MVLLAGARECLWLPWEVGGAAAPLRVRAHGAGTSFFSIPGTQTLSCTATGADVRFQGPVARVLCAEHCQEDPAAVVYGSTVHPMRSAVCMSAIVDQVMPSYGGELMLTKAPGLPSYTGKDIGVAGSLGMTGEKGPSWHAYAVDNIDLPAALPFEQPGNCTMTFDSLGMKGTGTSLAIACRGGCAGQGKLEGTVAYTGASNICRAAQHAGVIGDEGGHVMVTKGHGQEQYFGTKAHMDTSEDFYRQDDSYTVAVPTPDVLARTRTEPAWDQFL